MKRKLEIQLEVIHSIELEREVCLHDLTLPPSKHIDLNFPTPFDNIHFSKIHVIRVYLKNDGVSEVLTYRDVRKPSSKLVPSCTSRSNMKRK